MGKPCRDFQSSAGVVSGWLRTLWQGMVQCVLSREQSASDSNRNQEQLQKDLFSDKFHLIFLSFMLVSGNFQRISA